MDKGAGDTDPSEYDDDEGDGVDLLEWRSTSPPERMASIPNLRLHIVSDCSYLFVSLWRSDGELVILKLISVIFIPR